MMLTKPQYKYFVSDLTEQAQAKLYRLLYKAYREYGYSHMDCLTLTAQAQDEKLDNLDELLTLKQRTMLRKMGEN